MLHQAQVFEVPRAGWSVACVFPAAKYTPVEVPLACWLVGGGCWRWFTIIVVVLIYDVWMEEERKLARGDKTGHFTRLELWHTWRFRQCKQNFVIHCSAVTMRGIKVFSVVWLLETWDTVWEYWLLFAVSNAWWFGRCMIKLGCFVCKIFWYPMSLGWWMGWKAVLLLWPAVVCVVNSRVVQLLWWLQKLCAEIFLQFLHVMTYIKPLAFYED